MGAKAAGFNACKPVFAESDQLVETLPREIRRSRRGEAGSHALAGVGGERELADQQKRATAVDNRQVHLAVGIAEYAVTQQSFGHAPDAGVIIARLDRYQRQQSVANGADALAIDMHGGFGDTLDKGNHLVDGGQLGSTDAGMKRAQDQGCQRVECG